MAAVEEVAAALEAGEPVILPTDTVYGLCAVADREEPVRRLYRLKGRRELQPTALVASALDVLFELLPELGEPEREVASALLPGAYTLVVSNPARRYRWLTGSRPETIGVRVPALVADARAAVERVGAIAATSANVPGGADPRRVADVPEQIRAGCAAVLDAGELPGTPSTIVDLTTPEPRVLREGAGSVDRVLAVANRRRE